LLNRIVALGVTLVTLFVWCTGLAGATPEPPEPPALTAGASATARGLVVRSDGFFPVMLIDQCTGSQVRQARTLGVNLILDASCRGLAPKQQLAMIGPHALAVLPIAGRAVRGSGLVGWTYPDEPEGNGWTPAELRRAHPYVRGNPDGLVTFVTTGPGFFRSPYRDVGVSPEVYAKFAGLADFAGFDLYPLSHCQSDLGAVYDAQRAFARLAKGTPTFQWIETGPIRPTYCGGFSMTPAELKAEVWLAVAGGARGIGYFTHTWSPAHRAFDVSPPLRHSMWEINSVLSGVKPGLIGETVISAADSSAIKLVARSGGGKTYVFAVNHERAPLAAQLRVPALRNGSLQVFGEHRSVRVVNHNVDDHFGPLAVHVYIQANE
jgi:hypothetical protein